MREAVGDSIDIMVDCHARPSPAMGLKFGKALDPYGLYFFEEPCWPESVDGLAMITGSHNPSEYNGFKMGTGNTTFYGETIQQLRKLIEASDYEKSDRKGSVTVAFDQVTVRGRDYPMRDGDVITVKFTP